MPDFPPEIPLSGGPYDGKTTAEIQSREMPDHGVLFFPDRVHVNGPDGFAVYALADTRKGKKGTYDPEGV